MRSGNREAAAEFLMRYGSRVRRRIRGKLAPTMRRVFDSMDILSTLGRRLDLYVMSGKVQASNEAQLWSLLFKMADHALVDKARMFRTSQEIERENSIFASKHTSDDNDGLYGIDHCLGLLDDPVDRSVLSLWLVGDSHVEIGRQLKLGADAVRKRFKRIQTLLKERFQTGVA
jgi:DNA-directed RNA polymerase specialized sigma24 family protein